MTTSMMTTAEEGEREMGGVEDPSGDAEARNVALGIEGTSANGPRNHVREVAYSGGRRAHFRHVAHASAKGPRNRTR